MKPTFTLAGQSGVILSLAFSADGKRLASGNSDGTTRLWDVGDRMELATFKFPEPKYIHGVAFTPDGTTLLSLPETNPACVQLFDVAGEKELPPLENLHGNLGRSLAMAPDGALFATGAYEGEVKLWDTATRKVRATLEGFTATPTALAFSPDSKYLAAVSKFKVALWVVARGKMRAAPEVPDGPNITGVAFSPDGLFLAISRDGNGACQQFDIASGEPRPGFQAGDYYATNIKFFPDGKYLALHAGGNEKIPILDAATGAVKLELIGGSQSYNTGLAVSPNGQWVAAGSNVGIEMFHVGKALGG